MQVCLIVPGPLATVSGGHIYDRRMAHGLRALGHEVRVVELDGRLPDPDQAAIYAARTAWAALPADSVPLIDGLALPAFDGLPLHQVTAWSIIRSRWKPACPTKRVTACARRRRRCFGRCRAW